MLDQLKSIDRSKLSQLADVRNIGLYIFSVIVLAISWSGVKTLQNNYELEKRISTLKQQNTVLQLQNENTNLQNSYYQTDEYLDLAARQDLGLAGPGEKVMLIPRTVALKYVDQNLDAKSSQQPTGGRSKLARNLEAWRDFLLGRNQIFD